LICTYPQSTAICALASWSLVLRALLMSFELKAGFFPFRFQLVSLFGLVSPPCLAILFSHPDASKSSPNNACSESRRTVIRLYVLV